MVGVEKFEPKAKHNALVDVFISLARGKNKFETGSGTDTIQISDSHFSILSKHVSFFLLHSEQL